MRGWGGGHYLHQHLDGGFQATQALVSFLRTTKRRGHFNVAKTMPGANQGQKM